MNNLLCASLGTAESGYGRYAGGVNVDSSDFNDDFDNYPHLTGKWQGAAAGAVFIQDGSDSITQNLNNRQCVLYWYDKDNVMNNSQHAAAPYYTMIPEGNFFGKCN